MGLTGHSPAKCSTAVLSPKHDIELSSCGLRNAAVTGPDAVSPLTNAKPTKRPIELAQVFRQIPHPVRPIWFDYSRFPLDDRASYRKKAGFGGVMVETWTDDREARLISMWNAGVPLPPAWLQAAVGIAA